jgi:tRNA A37 threonylcarbamoyladenosine dehydratase
MEFIMRSGVGEMTIIDGDTVDPTNRNRQLPAPCHKPCITRLYQEDRLQANPEIKIHVISESITSEM